MIELLLLAVGFCASTIGAICGIGGGVIIKPLLDSLNIAGVDTISFLSGLTVLSMSAYSTIKTFLAKEKGIDLKTGTPLAIGAALGGILGKQLFSILKNASANPSRVGAYQAISLGIATFGTLIYTLKKKNIKTKEVKNPFACVIIGLVLGMMSSFMGIGGGPFNQVVLSYFFSMGTKEAAQNSLYVILISQISSLITTLVTNSVPEFKLLWLIIMAGSGILGGIVGRKINKKIDAEAVNKLFIGFLFIIIGISIYNAVRFL